MEHCAICKGEFKKRQDYLSHTCLTGFTPADLEHQGTKGILVAKASLERTGKLTKTREAELDAKLDAIKEKGVDHILMEARKK